MTQGKYRDIFENLPIGILRTRPDGSIVGANPAAARVLGFSSPSEIIATVADIGRQVYVDPRQREQAMSIALRDGYVANAEVVMRRKDGQEFPASVSFRVVRDARGEVVCFEGTVEDITERRRIEDALRRSEQQYRELVENANSIILRWTRDGRVAFLNEFGRRFFAYAEQEITGRHVVGTIVPESGSAGRDMRALMDEICADPKKFEHNVNENVCRDGRLVWIDWTNKVVLDEEGQVKEILSIGSDITERVKVEEELVKHREHLEELVEKRTAELAEARDRAESADRLKSAFLATMSHELRTPLNSIIGFTGILLQGLVGPLNEEQKKQLGMVRDSSNHLLNLINDVLDISKIEAGQLLVMKGSSFDLRGTIQRAVRTALPLAERKGLTIDVDVAPEVGTITSDQRRVEQILLNLLSNAVKFTDAGSIRIQCQLSGGNAVIRVIDHGIGIRSEDMDSLFKPFRQVDAGITRRYEGTGLGLSICKKLVEALDGTIGVESEWGKGSVFCVVLPYGRRTT
jgi:PAS domain S-box-containing protein